MKVLFVSSGNSSTGISPLIMAQGDSLKELGLVVEYYQIKGRGWKGYLANIRPLRKLLKTKKYDLVHAHFSLSGFVSALAGARPLVVSLMGWNVKRPLLKPVIKVFNWMFWQACIVKSAGMRDSLNLKNLVLLPNGVDLELFRPMDKLKARARLGWTDDYKHILFAANPARPIKNFTLAKQAVELLKRDSKAELHVLQGVKHADMPYLYNAADVVLLTSIAEGSPNVIKEAMACNCVIVSTDVGDVRERFGDSQACFICGHDPAEVCAKLLQALAYKGSVNTREAVLGLDSLLTARRLLSVYQEVIDSNR